MVLTIQFKKTGPILLLSLLLLWGTSVSAQNSCNCAAFRLDYVQDFWLTSVQQAVMQAFIDTDTPLTVGVLGNNFGQDMDLVPWIRDQTVRNPNTPLEIACNGWQDEDITQLTLNAQTSLLQTATRTIERFLWVPPIKVFIPPQGKYNSDTLTAMRARNMTHVSTFTSLDSLRPYPLSGQSVYRFPSGSGLHSQSNPSVGITAQLAYSQLSTGIARDGFSVVQLSLSSFAMKSNGEAIDAVNQTMITELKNLLTMTRSGGYSIVPISKINTDAPTTKQPVDYSDIYSCNCVSFRIDDIQDFFMTTQQYSLINAFIDNQVGMSIGIIANKFGQDTQLVSFVRAKASNATAMVEIANHGLNHEDFTTLSETSAVSTMDQAQGIIQSATGIRPTTFFLPYNTFNNATINAMKTVGFTRFSSSIDLDTPLYNLSNPDLWHFPAGAQTSNPDIEDYFEYLPSTRVWSDLQKQLDRDGFAVVMVHPQDFSDRNPDNTYTQALNQTSMNDFINLIQNIKSAGIRIVPMGAISSYLTPVSGPQASPSPSASTPPSPSAVPSPSSPAAASPSPVAPSVSPIASTSPATSQLPSSSPGTQTSSSPAASRQPSTSPAGRDTGDSMSSSSSVKVQPLGALSILVLVITAIMGAQ